MQSKNIFKKALSGLLVLSLSFGVISEYGCRTKDPVAAKQSYAGVTLNYYKPFDDTDVMKPLIDEYVATHPGLVINYKKFADFDEYQKVVLSEMAEGKGPDIFSMPNWWFASNMGKIATLPQSKVTGGMTPPEAFSDLFVDVAYKDLVRVDANGDEQVYALPMTVDTLALYYNKDHFDDRLPDPGKPATTWEGIKEQVPLLNKVNSDDPNKLDVSAIAIGRWDNISRAVDILYLLFLQMGVHFYNDTMSDATFASRHDGLLAFPGLEALDLFISFADPKQKFYSWGESSADPASVDKEIDAFARGNLSMMIGYAYTYNDIINRMDVLKAKGESVIDKTKIRVAQIPQIYDPKVSQEKRVTYANYFAETVSRNSKNSEIAWDFLIFLTSKTSLEKYFDKIHKPTSRRDMVESQAKDPVYGVFARQTSYAESFPILDYFKYKTLFTDVMRKAYLAGEGKKGNLVEAQDYINTMLPRGGYIFKKRELTEEEKKQQAAAVSARTNTKTNNALDNGGDDTSAQ